MEFHPASWTKFPYVFPTVVYAAFSPLCPVARIIAAARGLDKCIKYDTLFREGGYMSRARTASWDMLGIAAFASAVGNLVQADNRRKLRVLYQNLLARYREVCGQYQTLTRVNQQLQHEVLDLRAQNDRLQQQVTVKGTAS